LTCGGKRIKILLPIESTERSKDKPDAKYPNQVHGSRIHIGWIGGLFSIDHRTGIIADGWQANGSDVEDF
jgi:hypothetical protein